MNKETQTVEEIETALNKTLTLSVEGQVVYDTLNQEQKRCLHTNIEKGVRYALKRLHQAHQQELEKVRREERERIRDVVNEEAKKSFYVGKEMWRNEAYELFVKRIFDAVFGKALTPKDLTDKE